MNELIPAEKEGNVKHLALSLSEQYNQDRTLMSKPISTLAKLKGLKMEEVYKKLIPGLLDKEESEALRFAEIGLQLAIMVDKNRLREEIGGSFILAMDLITQVAQDGLESDENWLKRKAMKLYSSLLDEASEKQRFVEVVLTEKKIEMIAKSMENISSIDGEILEFESKNGDCFALART